MVTPNIFLTRDDNRNDRYLTTPSVAESDVTLGHFSSVVLLLPRLFAPAALACVDTTRQHPSLAQL